MASRTALSPREKGVQSVERWLARYGKINPRALPLALHQLLRQDYGLRPAQFPALVRAAQRRQQRSVQRSRYSVRSGPALPGRTRTAYSLYKAGNTRQPFKSGFPSLKAAAKYARKHLPHYAYRVERYQTNVPWRG